MSEYQCYEFVALERPLTKKQMTEIRAVSTRAEITPTRFWNEYHWGDFKGDPARLVARYFDAHLYFANWGTRRLMLRLPSQQVTTKSLRPYFIGEATRASRMGQHVIVDLCSDQDGSDNHDDVAKEGLLAALTPLRTELAQGDFRVAYLAWLLALQAGEVAEDATEAPVPPGWSKLTAAQRATVEFLRLDRDLLTAATAASPALSNDSASVRRWILALKPREKDEWLERTVKDPELALGAELLRIFRQQTNNTPHYGPRRSVAELLATAEDVRAKRERAPTRAPLRTPAGATDRKKH